MTPLPVIVGFGGVNPAGRMSFHHSYRRLIIDALDKARTDRTYAALAQLMGLTNDEANAAEAESTRRYILEHTLLRRIEGINVSALPTHRSAELQAETLSFELNRRQLPQRIPETWQIEDTGGRRVRVTVSDSLPTMLMDTRRSRVSSAGQLPTGFEPQAQYPSRNHPRGLQLAIYAASDALRATGFEVDALKASVRPDEFAVYSGSAMGQLDENGYGGLMHAEWQGKRPTSKQIALGLPEMPSDFINAYVLGSVGSTAGVIGACATFLYCLKAGVDDIRSGRRRIVLVGNAEAPVLADAIEGYRTMGALAEDDALAALDGTELPDHRRACRPFSDNCGFTLAEAASYFVLMDDALALELGAQIHGSVPDVFINADGYKKSIPGPGIGNYLTVAKAMDCVRGLIGARGLRERCFIQAHGTGTPQNRVTESHILNTLAAEFGIERWLVGAVKSYLGHTIAAAGGDQLSTSLGIWHDGWFPGITSITHVADDVHQSHLELPLSHLEVGTDRYDAALLNSKGFGGNNATAAVLSPALTRRMLTSRHGAARLVNWEQRSQRAVEAASSYDDAVIREGVPPIYRFGEGVVEGEELDISADRIQIPGFPNPVLLNGGTDYPDLAQDD